LQTTLMTTERSHQVKWRGARVGGAKTRKY
jgi:hypothetical protein